MAAREEHSDDAPPRFCPRCRKPGPDGEALCPECGETMLDRGFCHVCGRYWLLAVGAACPKHEIGLEEGPPPSLHGVEGKFIDWISVAAYPQPSAAEAP